jgi:hypothetical protein
LTKVETDCILEQCAERKMKTLLEEKLENIRRLTDELEAEGQLRSLSEGCRLSLRMAEDALWNARNYLISGNKGFGANR